MLISASYRRKSMVKHRLNRSKCGILDVKATGERGDIFVVEFQISERATFADRMTYHSGRAFSSQMFQGDPYSTLKAVIAIAVTTFEMFPKLKSIHNTFRLKAKANPSVVLTNLLQMHILEAAHNRGKGEGKAERDIEVARNMESDGCHPEFISRMTGLSADEIERLG